MSDTHNDSVTGRDSVIDNDTVCDTASNPVTTSASDSPKVTVNDSETDDMTIEIAENGPKTDENPIQIDETGTEIDTSNVVLAVCDALLGPSSALSSTPKVTYTEAETTRQERSKCQPTPQPPRQP